ncbi:YtxH domain-containing protein [Aeromicrobium sp. HA]|uniref:YtxH domain-containing protein n=1 Tax=Aeromicrobium sp. HA TaxID=3009077 RepID=UPI0022AF8C6C|nr:YtxH domain-containing protein [Aeromicrobium sp. HA]
MARKLTFLVGAAAGYVLGTRSGRERYDQIVQKAQSLWKDPRVQDVADKAQHAAQEHVPGMGGSDSGSGSSSGSRSGFGGSGSGSGSTGSSTGGSSFGSGAGSTPGGTGSSGTGGSGTTGGGTGAGGR